MSYILTDVHLARIMPTLKEHERAEYYQDLALAMDEFEINSTARAAAFLAQIAHESSEFRFFHEVWGPTAQQEKYEPHTSLSKELGNIEKGDGFRFRGRGAIQITGRANYEKFGALIGEDLIADPDLAAQMPHAFRIAGAFWKHHGLNELADAGEFKEITKKINGGYTGQVNREKYYERALRALVA